MSTSDWDQMVDWWDEKLGDDGDLWHRALIDPSVIQLAGDVKGLHVLDLACGNGYLSRRFANQGAIVTAVDASALLIERARGREQQSSLGITYHASDAARLEMLQDNAFDLVICNMALMDIENAAGTIQEVSRVLKPRGRFVASISHPCFDKVDTSGWAVEYIYPTITVWRKMSHYRKITTSNLRWFNIPNKTVDTRSYHRPLSWYVRTLRASGLLIAALEEPAPTEEFVANERQGPWIAEIPLHCVIEAWKIS
jgi:ubiquinone/menaquinone biosynthesis C-methylase UbiE